MRSRTSCQQRRRSRQGVGASSCSSSDHLLYRHHQDIIPTTIRSFESASELKIQSKRLSLGSHCSISTLGDGLSHDHDDAHDRGLVLLPESPIPPIHRWKQILGKDNSDLDLPPIGPKRSTGNLDDFQEHASNNEAISMKNGNQNRSRRLSLDTPPCIALRRSSNHVRADLSTNDDDDDASDYGFSSDEDDSSAISPGVPRISSDRPPELARRLMSPLPTTEVNGVNLMASEIRSLGLEAELLSETPQGNKALAS
ncbi:unnamed protein product [Cylindrotheca closterium]|uniref:Uncharacterized protein n=1 Tax=Cylindrotheca closterium TaxID=2856 RepID=A0AAD2G1H6_9STRA|nr:unnamed protein product [Cylindrotheca closterium]